MSDTGARELREELRSVAATLGRVWPQHWETAELMVKAAAALERVEALTLTNVLLRQGLERVATHLEKCPYAPNRGCAEAMQGEAEATLRQAALDWISIPAPAGAKVGET